MDYISRHTERLYLRTKSGIKGKCGAATPIRCGSPDNFMREEVPVRDYSNRKYSPFSSLRRRHDAEKTSSIIWLSMQSAGVPSKTISELFITTILSDISSAFDISCKTRSTVFPRFLKTESCCKSYAYSSNVKVCCRFIKNNCIAVPVQVSWQKHTLSYTA